MSSTSRLESINLHCIQQPDIIDLIVNVKVRQYQATRRNFVKFYIANINHRQGPHSRVLRRRRYRLSPLPKDKNLTGAVIFGHCCRLRQKPVTAVIFDHRHRLRQKLIAVADTCRCSPKNPPPPQISAVAAYTCHRPIK
jgi:hypothetical protein